MGTAQGKLLNNWKQIAQYLGRGVRTVQRWEQDLRMPVHRPRGKTRSAVVAFTHELEDWLSRTPVKNGGAREPGSIPQAAPTRLRVLVVENDLHDLKKCVAVLERLGAEQVDALSNISTAMFRMQNIMEGTVEPPDLIILDLDFSKDSGFEILRIWKANPKLNQIPLVVWTHLGETEQKLCQYFGVRKIIPKWAGTVELENAVRVSAS